MKRMLENIKDTKGRIIATAGLLKETRQAVLMAHTIKEAAGLELST